MLKKGRILLWLLFASCILADERPIALIGTVITPDKSIANGTLLILNQQIVDVGIQVTIPHNAIVINTNGVILPGLIDLHNHPLWNVLPRWHPLEEFRNRYEWLDKSVFLTFLGGPYNALTNANLSCAMQWYAEVKAITQGTTSFIGGLNEPCSRGLIRNLDGDPTLGKILYNVNPLQMTETEANDAKNVLASNGSLIIHVGEGLSNDGASTRELSMLKARGLFLPGVSLIHGVSLKENDFQDLAGSNVGFIWSPRSNLELYGQTANVEAAKNSNVLMALAPDWSATGSDGLLAELNFAATWNIGLEQPLFDDKTLVEMATMNAAKLVHLHNRLGSLQKGFLADILVLTPSNRNESDIAKYWTITHAIPEDVALVMVGGKALYGEPTIMKQIIEVPTTLETINICGANKSILFAEEFRTEQTFQQIETTLRNALRRNSRTLGPLSDCGI